MQLRHALRLACLSLVMAFSQSIKAEIFFSTVSLKILCQSGDPSADLACKTYLHGIVETWMVKDIVSIDNKTYRYVSRGNEPTFCETINKVSENEWLAIVRGNLNSMKPGLATIAVMEALSNKLCK